MKRSKTYSVPGAHAFTVVAALGLLAPTVGYAADVANYKFSAPVCAKDAYEGASLMQVGDLNNKGQFTVNFIHDGEKIYVWDGSALRKLSEADIKISDGSAFSTGNVWSPHAINDNGVVAWVADMDASAAGVKYVLTYEIATGKYNIIAAPGMPADGGGEFLDNSGGGPGGRMVADINNAGQVVWNVAVEGPDGEPAGGVFMYDPATQKITAVARPGTPAPGGGTITNAWWPNVSESGQVSFSAAVDGAEEFGVYVWDKGTISAVAAPGTQVGDLTIAAARWARMAGNGDIAFVGDVGGTANAGNAEVTEDTAAFLYTAADKKLTAILKPGDALPGGGEFVGVEPNRRAVVPNSRGQVLIVGIRADATGGVYIWDNGKLDALFTTGQDLAGVGTVTAVGYQVNGWDGYHSAINDNGDVLVPAQIDGLGCYVLATAPAAAPAPEPAPEPTAGG